MEFSRLKYWKGSLSLLQGNLPNQGIEPRSPALQGDSLQAEPQGKPSLRPKKGIKLSPNFFLEFHLPQTTRARLAERRPSEQKQFSLGADSNLSKESPHQAASAELRHALPRLGKQVPTHLRGWRSVLTLSENCRQQSPALI